MTLSIATTSIPGNLRQKLEVISAAGFDGIELFEPDFTCFDGTAMDVANIVGDLGLKIDIFQPFEFAESRNGTLADTFADQLEHKFNLMQSLGTDLLLVKSNQSRYENSDPSRLADSLAEISERAAQQDLRIAFLARPWGSQISTEMEALDFIQKIDKSNLGLVLNSFYTLLGGEKPALIRDMIGERVFHVQLSDLPMADRDARQTLARNQCLPGQGNLDLAGFVRVLAKSGYTGSWAIDGAATENPKGNVNSAARDGFRSLVTLLGDVAKTEPDFSPDLPQMPDRVYASGIEFVEFAVDKRNALMLTNILTSLCFRMERKHISKSVELWRQGAVNVVVNTEQEGYARSAYLNHGPSVCDMGLRVQDADQTVARATALGTPEFLQPLGTGELDIPAIRSVGGNVIHFIDEKSDLHRVWDIEFNPVTRTEATQPAGIRRIDHIAQTMKFKEMQSWLLYFTSTFEMEKTPIVDVADPAGVIQSQAISSPEGEVRLNLNGASDGQTFAGSFLADHLSAGVQHIALLSDDIFETSDYLAAAGFERLAISADYYSDLKSVFGLEDAFVASLKQANILYDRNGKAEFFQIYSIPVFDGFFFEVVQRRGGYQGYGARNAPFRLSAQMKYMRPTGMPKS